MNYNKIAFETDFSLHYFCAGFRYCGSMAEQHIRNVQVVGSIPTSSSNKALQSLGCRAFCLTPILRVCVLGHYWVIIPIKKIDLFTFLTRK